MQNLLLGDLVSVRQFPPVVQAADVRALRADLRVLTSQQQMALDDFCGGYLAIDERSRHALERTLRGLSSGAGGAFFFNGVFGSGKSHLLGLLALLSEGYGREPFVQTHPQFAETVENIPSLFGLYFSLDEYSAARSGLEDILWREVGREWQRRGWDNLPNVVGASRGESFTLLEEAIATHDCSGIAIFIDELSLFLSGRQHRGLQDDASFLQFLGQRARRSSSASLVPLYVFATLQKNVEDIGDLDAYALSQIKDRFHTLPLSLAHLPSLIEQRLIVRRDVEKLNQHCDESYQNISRALPHLDFGREEWQRLYPFHPAIVALLEHVAARYGSRTRSAVLFCQHIVKADAPANNRVIASQLWDYLEPELEAHPDLKPLLNLWQQWPQIESEATQDEREALLIRDLWKTLLLCKVAGISPSVIQLANALLLDARLPGNGNYQYTRVLLEKMRAHGAGLAIERHDDELHDRYTVDIGARVGEMVRRYTRNALQTLPPRDGRIATFVLQCCRQEPLPLATLHGAQTVSVLWRNTPRNIRVQLASELPDANTLSNLLGTLPELGSTEHLLLFIAPPFALPENAADTWLAMANDANRVLEEMRWRGALLWWLPREASNDEWQQAREATAQHLLSFDPQLSDNRKGRAVQEYLRNQLASGESALAQIAARLLHEGVVTTGAGQSVEASELAGGESWNATLEAIAAFALPQVFPKFSTIAPRLRVLTSANADALCLEILRRPRPFFSASNERIARALCEPLGSAKESNGRFAIQAPRDDLKTEIIERAKDGVSLVALEAELERSEWSLASEQTRLCISALLRSGELTAFDSRGAQLPTAEIGMPLRRSVHALRPGRLIETKSWDKLIKLCSLLNIESTHELNFAAQEQMRAALMQWHEEALAATELAQARLHQLRRALGHSAAQWPETEETLQNFAAILRVLESDGATLLESAATLESDKVLSVVQKWNSLTQNVQDLHLPLLRAYGFLSHRDLVAPPQLSQSRDELLSRFTVGETILDDETLLRDFANWRVQYESEYAAWHSAQNEAARGNSFRRVVQSDIMRVLERLRQLSTRRFETFDEVSAAIQEELQKMCSRNGALLDDPVCPVCRLLWGQRVKLRDPRELEQMPDQGLEVFRQAIREENVTQYLSRRAPELLEWNSVTELLPILNDETLRVLDEAFAPRRSLQRSWRELENLVVHCRTRGEFRAALLQWLDADESPHDEDEIVMT